MARENFEILGMDDLMTILNGLPKSLRHDIVKKSFSDIGRRTILKDARNLVPVAKEKWDLTNMYESRKHDVGNLKKTLGIIQGKSKKYPTVMVGVRSRMTFRKGPRKYDGWYAHMVEYGHYRTDKSGHRLYYVLPQPFMRPAIDNNRRRVFSMMGESISRIMGRYINKARKYAGG